MPINFEPHFRCSFAPFGWKLWRRKSKDFSFPKYILKKRQGISPIATSCSLPALSNYKLKNRKLLICLRVKLFFIQTVEFMQTIAPAFAAQLPFTLYETTQNQ
jgi:hypothetical protein